MLANPFDSSVFREMAEYISDDGARNAFRYLFGLAAEDPRFTCYPNKKGDVLDFRFDSPRGDPPFSFIANRSFLLFYFRKPSIDTQRWTVSELNGHFDSANENPSGEFTVKLRSISDVQRLWRLVGANADRFQSGSSENTKIGFVNQNHQRCAGHRGNAGSDHLQFAYRMECQKPGCDAVYGANGSDVFQRVPTQVPAVRRRSTWTAFLAVRVPGVHADARL